MTTEEQTTETQVSEVQKSDDVDTSVTSILAQLVKAQEARIDSFEKRFDGLETLIKEHNKNPVDQGVEDDTQAPAVSSPNDVGDPDNLGNTYAPSPKDQASIVPPQKGESPKTDAPSLTMGKADVTSRMFFYDIIFQHFLNFLIHSILQVVWYSPWGFSH